ncbi:MAG: hypothetical protein IPG39_19535 [Bacteroidetes bacterium]|nr:hypothetical protein [Bacteroidota bacterium]
MKKSGDFIRKDKNNGKIKLTLVSLDGTKTIQKITTIKKEPGDTSENLRQSIDFPDALNELFFCGYGVEIGNTGSTSFKTYSPLEAVFTLFNYNSELQNPELIMRRHDESPARKFWRINY